MKKLTVLMAILFASAMVFGQKDIRIFQNGDGNIAELTQNSCISGDVNTIKAEQNGDLNSLRTWQTGYNNFLNLLQAGDDNYANLDQRACDCSSASYNEIKVEQSGSDNLLITYQKAWDNYLQLKQTSMIGGNRAFMDQEVCEDDWDYTNVADIYQSGNLNYANLYQAEDNLAGTDRSTNIVKTRQSGNENDYFLVQGSQVASPKNEQYLITTGDDNTARMYQYGYKNYSQIKQEYNPNINRPDNNSAKLWQYAYYSPHGVSESKSYSWQYGNENQVRIEQRIGNIQYAYAYQDGLDNLTKVDQIGVDDQDVLSYQEGNDKIVVNQTDN